MDKYVFIINPISGGNDKSNFKTVLKNLCEEKSLDYYILETTGDNDLNVIKDHCDSRNITVAVACGGDGTVNLTTEAIIGKKIKLGIIPLGSANGLAAELDIPDDVEDCLDMIIAGKTIQSDILLINEKHLSLHLSDLGFNARMIKNFEKSGMRGKLSYAWHLIDELSRKTIFAGEIQLNGENIKMDLEMLIFANSRKYGTGAVVNPDGQMDDEKFEICLFKPYPRRNILILTYLFFSGKLKQSNYIEIKSTDSVTVKINKAQTLQVDGEVIGDFKNIRVSLHPDKIALIIP